MEGFLLASEFNLVPSLVLYGVGKMSRRIPLKAIFSLIGLAAFSVLGPRHRQPAGELHRGHRALMFIPLYAVGALFAAWLMACWCMRL